jgi:hypothetical protein
MATTELRAESARDNYIQITASQASDAQLTTIAIRHLARSVRDAVDDLTCRNDAERDALDRICAFSGLIEIEAEKVRQTLNEIEARGVGAQGRQ